MLRYGFSFLIHQWVHFANERHIGNQQRQPKAVFMSSRNTNVDFSVPTDQFQFFLFVGISSDDWFRWCNCFNSPQQTTISRQWQGYNHQIIKPTRKLQLCWIVRPCSWSTKNTNCAHEKRNNWVFWNIEKRYWNCVDGTQSHLSFRHKMNQTPKQSNQSIEQQQTPRNVHRCC